MGFGRKHPFPGAYKRRQKQYKTPLKPFAGALTSASNTGVGKGLCRCFQIPLPAFVSAARNMAFPALIGLFPTFGGFYRRLRSAARNNLSRRLEAFSRRLKAFSRRLETPPKGLPFFLKKAFPGASKTPPKARDNKKK